MSQMKRAVARPLKQQENYEHVLMCLICRSLFDDHDHQPKFLPCHHTFCKECLREYVRQMGDDIECPSCRKVATIPAAGVAALQTNFYAKYIQSLVYGYGLPGFSGSVPKDGTAEIRDCTAHSGCPIEYYCRDCSSTGCQMCVGDAGGCAGHRCVPLGAATEQFHQSIDASFANANTLIERKKVELEGLLKTLSEEKDRALLKIDSTFEAHVHVLSRRATLLKNNVIDVYNEHVAALESDLEEISTAMTCVVSLKEYHETNISRGDFTDADKGIDEIDEVHANIYDRIKPSENHIVFFEKHGADKFRACATDLGRVVCNRSGSRPSSTAVVQNSGPTSPDDSSIGTSELGDVVSVTSFSLNTQTSGPNGQIKETSDFILNNDSMNCVNESKIKVENVRKEGAKKTSSSTAVKTFLDNSEVKPLDSSGGNGNQSHASRATNQSPRLLFDGTSTLQMSFDEQRLRRELTRGEGQGEVGGTGRGSDLARSDFWGTLSNSVEGSLDKDVMVAELSGPQTSL